MNWPVKALGLVLPALFLFSSCVNEPLTIGFPTGSDIVEQRYLEYTPDSYIIYEDSTTTQFGASLPVGNISSEQFGEIAVESISRVVATSGSFDDIEVGDIVDSSRLTLIINQYSTDLTMNSVKINMGLLLPFEQPGAAYTFTEFPVDSLVQQLEVPIDLSIGNPYADTVDIDMDPNFSQGLLDFFLSDPNIANNLDSLNNISFISKHIPGYKFWPTTTTQGIIRIASGSSLRLNVWHKSPGDTVSTASTLVFNGFNAFNLQPNKNETGWSGSPLEGLETTDRTRFDPSDNKIYSFNLGGIYSVFDLKDLSALDTIENGIITNAILQISGIEKPSEFNLAPSRFEMYLLDENNELVVSRTVNNRDVFRKIYQGMDSDSAATYLSAPSPRLSPTPLFYNSFNKAYEADITLYLNSIPQGDADLYKVMLVEPSFRQQFNRISVDKSNVKLKIFYSKRIPQN